MSATEGYYSVIQYCPDRSRMEAANIGVMLLCPEIGFVGARTSAGNDRISHFFGRASFDPQRVNAAKRAIEKRLEIDRESFRTPEDLVHFMDTRGNDIMLTPPRPMKVAEPEVDLNQLFQELVGGRSRREPRAPQFQALDDLFHRASLRDRVILPPPVAVPVLRKTLKIPYAYRNGRLNLVKPKRFGPDGDRATSTAMRLALQGDLLQRHPEEQEERKLVVVSVFDHSDAFAELRDRVDGILGEYDVRIVHDDQMDQFAAEVEEQAH